MLTHERVDITSAAPQGRPFSFYEGLQRDHPVCPVALPNGTPARLISRYDDVVAALKDPRLVQNRRPCRVRMAPDSPGHRKSSSH